MHQCQYFVFAYAKWNDLCPKTDLCGERPATDCPSYRWPTVLKLCDMVKVSVFTS